MERASPRALIGWKREQSRSGIVVTLQLIADHAAYRAGEVDRVPVVLSDRQLRSFARDLARANAERGMDLFARRPWWKFWARP